MSSGIIKPNGSKYSTKSFSKFSVINPLCVPEPWISSRLTTPLHFPIFFGDVSLLKISLKYFIPSVFFFFFFFFPSQTNQSWIVVYLENDPIIGIELKGLFFPSNKPFHILPQHQLDFPNFQKKRL